GAGTDAAGAGYIQLAIAGGRMAGAAIDRDSVGASLRAVLSALDRAAERAPAEHGRQVVAAA
ncbi:MAG: hypothetical protein K9L70_14790, partial [Thiohalocapsa sp.]|nr:hypothetical protein [Thiohalocapsa sp.]